MYYLGLDIGSSSIKAALTESDSGKIVDVVKVPEDEMSITSVKPKWAEQDPKVWWNYIKEAIKKLLKDANIDAKNIEGIGISYQMHGLVVVDKDGELLRDAIIWCDSRAVETGRKAFKELGEKTCSEHFLNSPSNFTASKLKWVKENEPNIYRKIDKMMLPGDYIAFKLSDKINTTRSGLSEGILWDFKENKKADLLLEHYGLHENLIPDIVETFGEQGTVSKNAAKETGLAEGTPILYRAGDQPNNALSLNVFHPGEVAATGGTSGVVYAITDKTDFKETTRINNFAHVNYSVNEPRIGKLLNINGAGIQLRWLKELLGISSYEEMSKLAEKVAIGSEGAVIIPFGNGAERMMNNEILGTQIADINLNIHDKSHLCRAALEGIAFSFVYGIEIMKKDGMEIKVMRVGNDNLFQSEVFSITIATLIDQDIEVYKSTGAVGAARACALKDGNYEKFSEYITNNDYVHSFTPEKDKPAYETAYQNWKRILETTLKNQS